MTVPELVPRLLSEKLRREKSTLTYLLGVLPEVTKKVLGTLQKNGPGSISSQSTVHPFDFENDDEACKAILRQIEESQAKIVVVGLGVPKQELGTHCFQKRIGAKHYSALAPQTIS